MDGFSWFLSRFDRPGNFIIVVECGDSSSSSANTLRNDQEQKIPLLYSMAVENLKMLASTPKSRRILLIRLVVVIIYYYFGSKIMVFFLQLRMPLWSPRCLESDTNSGGSFFNV